jgi:hypothetical protein
MLLFGKKGNGREKRVEIRQPGNQASRDRAGRGWVVERKGL